MGLFLLFAISGCAQKAEEKPAAPDVQTESAKQEELTEEDPKQDDTDGTDTKEDASDESHMSDMIKIWGTITSVDDSGITVDNQSENSSAGEMILVVDPSENTVIDAVTGFPVSQDEIQTGSFEAYLGPAMTMSLPPQTNPHMVIVNIPEDKQAPQYITAAEDPTSEDGIMTIQATDGICYQVPEDVEIIPFLTRNIVRPEDITKGSKCLIWQDEDGTAEKVVLFQ